MSKASEAQTDQPTKAEMLEAMDDALSMWDGIPPAFYSPDEVGIWYSIRALIESTPDPFAEQRREQREYCEKHAAPEGHRIVGYINHSPMEAAQLGEEYSPVVELIPAPLPAEVEEAMGVIENILARIVPTLENTDLTNDGWAALATIRAALGQTPEQTKKSR